MKKFFASILLLSLFLNTNQLLKHKEVKSQTQIPIQINHIESSQIYQNNTIDNPVHW